MKSLGVFLLCFSIQFLSFAGLITGKVVDENKEILPFVMVALKNAKDSSLYKFEMTDTLGKYSISAVSGHYFLEVRMLNYENFQSSIFELKENYQVETIQLIPQVELLGEVVIKAPEKPIIQKTPRGLEVNVANSPILSTGNTQDVLAKVPGIMMNPDGSLLLKGKAGVQIFIDGKRTYMSMEQLMQYLQSLPATDIERIEIYDVPPAKFDAEGAGGVINIVLKNGKALGTNGMMGVNTGYGKYHKFVPWMNVNHRTKKINIYGNVWYSNQKTFQLYDYTSVIPVDEQSITFDSKSTRIFTSYGMGGRLGVDYSINPKNTIGFLVFGYKGKFSSDEASTTYRSGDDLSSYNKVQALNERSSPWQGQGYNLNYQHIFKEGKEVVFDADFVQNNSNPWQKAQNQQYWNDQFLINNITDLNNITTIQILVGKVDYTQNLKKNWKLESGVKTSFVDTKNTNHQYLGTNEEPIVFDTINSNDFFYKEHIYAAYSTLQGSLIKNVDVDLGLRAEYTSSKGISPTLDTTTIRHYLNLFPNTAFKYKGIKDFEFSLAYARRLNRPNYWNLNPFEIQMNQFNYHKGNPYLQPQYASSYSLGTSYKNKLFTTISYTNTSKAMTDVLEQNEQTQLTYHTVINLDNIDNYSVNVVYSFQATKWWKINFDETAFYNHQQSPFVEGKINNSLWSYSLKMQNTFSLPKNIKMELGGYYNSSVFWNTLYVYPHYQLDIGASYTYNRFQFKLSYQDFLNIRQSFGWVRQGDVNRDYYYKAETRKMMLSISYRFGNYKINGARNRQSASEELQRRGDGKP